MPNSLSLRDHRRRRRHSTSAARTIASISVYVSVCVYLKVRKSSRAALDVHTSLLLDITLTCNPSLQEERL